MQRPWCGRVVRSRASRTRYSPNAWHVHRHFAQRQACCDQTIVLLIPAKAGRESSVVGFSGAPGRTTLGPVSRPRYCARNPPSTARTCPVTIADACDARNSAGPTMSSGSAILPIGVIALDARQQVRVVRQRLDEVGAYIRWRDRVDAHAPALPTRARALESC